MAFSKAFSAARKAGKKVFTYNGKSYNTKLAADTPKKGPIPSAAPREAKKATPKKAGIGPSKNTTSPRSKSQREGFIASEKRTQNDDLRAKRKKKK